MARSLAGPVSVAEYLAASDYEPDAEYVDGAIEERPMGEFDHAAWQQAIQLWFVRHAEAWHVWPVAELRVRVGPTRFRVPDVTILSRDWKPEQIITQPPVAVFEVLSPEDRTQRMTQKLNDYAAMGIGQIWVLDPSGPVFERFEVGQLRRRSEFGAAGERIHFVLAEMAACLPPMAR